MLRLLGASCAELRQRQIDRYLHGNDQANVYLLLLSTLATRGLQQAGSSPFGTHMPQHVMLMEYLGGCSLLQNSGHEAGFQPKLVGSAHRMMDLPPYTFHHVHLLVAGCCGHQHRCQWPATGPAPATALIHTGLPVPFPIWICGWYP